MELYEIRKFSKADSVTPASPDPLNAEVMLGNGCTQHRTMATEEAAELSLRVCCPVVQTRHTLECNVSLSVQNAAMLCAALWREQHIEYHKNEHPYFNIHSGDSSKASGDLGR